MEGVYMKRIALFAAVFVLLASMVTSCGNSKKAEQLSSSSVTSSKVDNYQESSNSVVQSNSNTLSSSQASDQEIEFGWNTSTSTTEEGTSARVDEVTLKGIRDAKQVSNDNAEPLLDEAFEYLKAHVNNYYESNEVMEKSMYYGSFIYKYIEENSGAKDIADLDNKTKAEYEVGWNTVKAIKYVYRGVDKIEDECTQNALKDVKENLEKLN